MSSHVREGSLFRNPFYLLEATPRDDRQRIVQLADRKLLELDQAVVRKARSALTNPRTRLGAEISWLPGVSPGRASQLIRECQASTGVFATDFSLPTLALANLIAATFSTTESPKPGDVPDSIVAFAGAVERISADDVLRDINEDRAVSGFPTVQAIDAVDDLLAERKRYYVATVKAMLDRLPTNTLVDVVTVVADRSTTTGQRHAPELIDDLIDMYRVEAQDFLQTEAANIDKLIVSARNAAPQGEGAVEPILTKIAKVTKNWDRVAQPIQLSFQARGQDHPASNEVARVIRGLAVDLHNDHGMLEPVQRLTNLLQEVFAEVPVVAERVEQDAEDLQDILENRERTEEERRKWIREIAYKADIGVLFKKTLQISADGVSWGRQRYALENISRVRWGGVRHSINGIPTGTTFTIAFGNDRSEAVVETRRKEVFTTFTEKLYRAVGVRLLVDLLKELRYGQVQFGDATIRDTGVVLPKRKFLGANESVELSWFDVKVWSADGMFFIGSASDEKVYAGMSYVHTTNVHILEQAIRMAMRKGMYTNRLSDVLQAG